MFGSLLATALNVVTLGGTLTDEDKTYTEQHIDKTIQDIKDIEGKTK